MPIIPVVNRLYSRIRHKKIALCVLRNKAYTVHKRHVCGRFRSLVFGNGDEIVVNIEKRNRLSLALQQL